MDTIKRFFIPPKRSFFLFGSRGTGKSTLLMDSFHDAIWVDLLKPEVERAYSSRPERLIDLIDGNPHKKVVVIDEIQRATGLLPVVHQLIFEKRGLQFILTGSSARKIKRAGSDLLGGRASQRVLHPFMAAELGKKLFSLENTLQYGLLPLLYGEEDSEDVLHAYVSLYLKEEVKAEGFVRSLSSFTRFLEVISFSHGSLLNISNISRESSIKRKTVENYVEILEELLLGFRLPVFSKRAQRELIAHPKFYIVDVGVYKALRPTGPLDVTHMVNGAAFEGLIAQHLRAWCDYSRDDYKLTFWRTRSGVEVDFVIYGPNGFWALEVKNTMRIDGGDVRSLNTFSKDYPTAKTALIYRGSERLKINGVMCLPANEFLLNLIPDKEVF